MQSTDVIIAGGGLMGLSSAYYLASKGLSVRLLDSGRIARQASWAGGGILWPLYAWRYPQAVQEMAQCGRRLYPAWCESLREETGIDPQFRECGLLVGDTQEQPNAQHWCNNNQESLEIIEDAGAAQAGLTLQTPVMRLPKVAQVRNPRLCKALAASLAASGVIIHEHEAVESVSGHDGLFQGMRSKQAFYPAKIGIVAAGAWSSQLVADTRLFPVKGQMLLLRGEPGLLKHILLYKGHYVIPRADGQILVGSTVEHAGFDVTTDANVQQKLQACAAELVPALGRLPMVLHWAGLRPATDDDVPFVGSVPGSSGLYINAGHYRNGVVTAPASAALLTRLITGGSGADDNLNVAAYSVRGR